MKCTDSLLGRHTPISCILYLQSCPPFATPPPPYLIPELQLTRSVGRSGAIVASHIATAMRTRCLVVDNLRVWECDMLGRSGGMRARVVYGQGVRDFECLECWDARCGIFSPLD